MFLHFRRFFCGLFCVFAAIAPTRGAEESDSEIRFGAAMWGGVTSLDAPAVPFNGIELPPDATEFSAADASHFGLLAEWNYYPTPAWFVGLRAGLEIQTAARFTATETQLYTDDNLIVRELLIQHTLDADLTAVGAGPVAGFHLPFLPDLRIAAGAWFSWPLSSRLIQEQSIVAPEGLTFAGGQTRVRSLDEEWTSVASPLVIGEIGMQFALASLSFGGWEPRILAGWRSPLQSIDADIDWNTQTLTAGLGLYEMATPPRPVLTDTTWLRDTVDFTSPDIEEERVEPAASTSTWQRQELPDAIYNTLIVRERYRRMVPEIRSLLLLGMQVSFVKRDGSESGNITIDLEEFVALERFPLLPYVFFERESAELAARYRGGAQSESAGDLATYWGLIDTLAARMQRFPAATLTLRGLSLDDEADLGLARAKTIKQAIVRRNAALDPQRIAVEGIVPDAAAIDRPELRDELRRVECSSDDPHLLEPAARSQVQRRADPPTVRFYPEVFAEAGIRDWRLEILWRDSVAAAMEGRGEPPVSLDWNLRETQEALGIALDQLRLDHRLTVTDGDGQVKSTERGSIDFRRTAPPSHIDTLEERRMLAWYAHNDTTLLPHHVRELHSVAESGHNLNNITVFGATDNTGSVDYNRVLSRQRAQGAARLLGPRARVADAADAAGLTVYDNALPEGRMYNRRVEILLLPDAR